MIQKEPDMMTKKFPHLNLRSSILRLNFLILVVSLSILSCKSSNDKDKQKANNVKDTLEIITSDFSKGSYFIVLKIQNTKYNKLTKIVIQNDLLAATMSNGKTKLEYQKKIMNAIKNDLPISVDTADYNVLVSDSVNNIDSSIINASLKGKMFFINKFFRKSNKGFYVQCFSNPEIEKQIIYVLINEYKLLLRTDDETGCIIIT